MHVLTKSNPKGFLTFLGRRWPILFLLIEFIVFGFIAGGFLSLKGIQIILFYGTSIFLLGAAETFVIITGGIDLSVGFIMGFASIVSAKLIVLFTGSGFSPALSILFGFLLTMLIGLIPGLINGTLVARLNVPPFIATFSMLGITQCQKTPRKNIHALLIFCHPWRADLYAAVRYR
ncbi:MAG: hypothetical protein AB1798_02890 [Spirochaetota bacterium]